MLISCLLLVIPFPYTDTEKAVLDNPTIVFNLLYIFLTFSFPIFFLFFFSFFFDPFLHFQLLRSFLTILFILATLQNVLLIHTKYTGISN